MRVLQTCPAVMQCLRCKYYANSHCADSDEVLWATGWDVGEERDFLEM